MEERNRLQDAIARKYAACLIQTRVGVRAVRSECEHREDASSEGSGILSKRSFEEILLEISGGKDTVYSKDDVEAFHDAQNADMVDYMAFIRSLEKSMNDLQGDDGAVSVTSASSDGKSTQKQSPSSSRRHRRSKNPKTLSTFSMVYENSSSDAMPPGKSPTSRSNVRLELDATTSKSTRPSVHWIVSSPNKFRSDERMEQQRILKQKIRKKLKKGLVNINGSKKYEGTSTEEQSKGFQSVLNFLDTYDSNKDGLLHSRDVEKCLRLLKKPLNSKELDFLTNILKPTSFKLNGSKTSSKLDMVQLRAFFNLGDSSSSSSSSEEEANSVMTSRKGLGNQFLAAERTLSEFLKKSHISSHSFAMRDDIFSSNSAPYMTGAQVLQEQLRRLDQSYNGKVTLKLTEEAIGTCLKQIGVLLDSVNLHMVLSRYPRDSNNRINYGDFLRHYGYDPLSSTIEAKMTRFLDKYHKDHLKRKGRRSHRNKKKNSQDSDASERSDIYSSDLEGEQDSPLVYLQEALEAMDIRRNDGRVLYRLSIEDFKLVMSEEGCDFTEDELEYIGREYQSQPNKSFRRLTKRHQQIDSDTDACSTKTEIDYKCFLRRHLSQHYQHNKSHSNRKKVELNDDLEALSNQLKQFFTAKASTLSSQHAFESADGAKNKSLTGMLRRRDFQTVLKTLGFPGASASHFKHQLMSLLHVHHLVISQRINYIEFLRIFEDNPVLTLGLHHSPSEGSCSAFSSRHAGSQSRIPNDPNYQHLGISGSIGEWLTLHGSPIERENFLSFMQHLEEFEETIKSKKYEPKDDALNKQYHIVLGLGPNLRVGMQFLSQRQTIDTDYY